MRNRLKISRSPQKSRFQRLKCPTNAEIESVPLRGQFNGLKDLIDALQSVIGGINTASNASSQVNLLGMVEQFARAERGAGERLQTG